MRSRRASGAILWSASSVEPRPKRSTPLLRISLLGAALALACVAAPVSAQNTLRARVVDAHEREPLPGVNVVLEGMATGGTTNADGLVTVAAIPDGVQVVTFSFVGFRPERRTLTFPLAAEDSGESLLVVALEEEELELDETTVTATRTSRSIADTPTRVETIAGEEIEEKIAMDPAGISMLLNESPGIVVQQTSAVSASAAFRMQGLDGRYTQLLRDGFPLYGGLGGGLSLLQTPPLDLAQVEVIKGPASTLYGGDAIAGLVNLVSKRPTENGDRSLLVNGTTGGGLDAAAYLARRNARLGYTFLASGNVQRAYDAEADGFTNLPATRRLTVSPTLYHYGAGTLTLRLSGTVEDREGGSVAAIRRDSSGFTERNESGRLTAAAGYERPLARGTGGNARLALRSSGSLFRRAVEVPGFRFAGRQVASYTEASAVVPRGAHEVVLGVDLRTDRFDQSDGGAALLDYAYASVGAFVQDTWDVAPAVVLETGLRLDAHSAYGAFALPRAAVLLRLGHGLTARVGGGLGYKAPTPFLEEAEARAYRGVLPIADSLGAERSAGGNADVSYRAVVGPLVLSLNQVVYLTRLRRPLVPVTVGEALGFATGDGSVRARGSETTARLSLDDVTLFLGYVYLDAEEEKAGRAAQLPLTARHRTYTVLVWEQHGRGRIGLEAYYTGAQPLPDGGTSPGYLVAGVMAQWRVGPVRVFGNLENVLDARQSRTAPLVLGPRDAPTFAPVWGPTDGFLANAGLILEF